MEQENNIVWVIILPILLTLAILMAQTSAKEAKSNIASWLELIGFKPKWANLNNIDTYVTIIGCSFALISIIAVNNTIVRIFLVVLIITTVTLVIKKATTQQALQQEKPETKNNNLQAKATQQISASNPSMMIQSKRILTPNVKGKVKINLHNKTSGAIHDVTIKLVDVLHPNNNSSLEKYEEIIHHQIKHLYSINNKQTEPVNIAHYDKESGWNAIIMEEKRETHFALSEACILKIDITPKSGEWLLSVKIKIDYNEKQEPQAEILEMLGG